MISDFIFLIFSLVGQCSCSMPLSLRENMSPVIFLCNEWNKYNRHCIKYILKTHDFSLIIQRAWFCSCPTQRCCMMLAYPLATKSCFKWFNLNLGFITIFSYWNYMLLYHKDNQVIDKTSLRDPYNNLHRPKIGHNGMHLLAKMPCIMYMTFITKAYVKKNNKIKIYTK